MLNDLFFTKSFVSYSTPLKHCFNCSYCRAVETMSKDFSILPEDINHEFKKLPVAINLMYGDPLLQVDNTVQKLRTLEKAGHSGPVIIITKGNIMDFPLNEDFNLDLHFGLSTFGCNSKYDGNTIERWIHNLETLYKHNKYKFSVEFRPIINEINDSDEIFDFVCKTSAEFGCAIGYSGLQVNETLREHLKSQGIEFKPYDNHKFGLKKYISPEREKRLKEIATEYNVPVFKKTSCLLSYVHNLPRDLNAHYYRPNEVGCFDCPLYDRCKKFKEDNNKKVKLDIEIPFKYELIHNAQYVCQLLKAGLCQFPSEDCKKISGTVIKIDEPVTTSDVRVIKWLTGFTVLADFREEPYISEKWKM